MNNMANEKNTTDMKMSPEQVDKVIGLMERVKAFIDKHGLKGTFTTLLTVFIAACVGYCVFNPGVVFEKVKEIQV